MLLVYFVSFCAAIISCCLVLFCFVLGSFLLVGGCLRCCFFAVCLRFWFVFMR